MSISLNSSVHDIQTGVDCSLLNNHLTAHNLEDAINREENGLNRTSLIKFLQSRLNKMTKGKTVIDGKAEIIGADWTLARQLFDGMNLTIRLTLAQQVFLGCELERIKKELGFTHGGKRKKASGQTGHLKTWEAHLEAEMPDLPRRTADRIITTYHAARAKLKKLGHAKGIALFDQSPDKLTNTQRKQLKDITDKITDGETQVSLLEDLKIIKGQRETTIGGAVTKSTKKTKPTMEQLAFALFTDPVQELCKLRAHCDYKKAINALPVTSPDPETVTLAAIEQHAKALLADVEKAKSKAAKGNS